MNRMNHSDRAKSIKIVPLLVHSLDMTFFFVVFFLFLFFYNSSYNFLLFSNLWCTKYGELHSENSNNMENLNKLSKPIFSTIHQYALFSITFSFLLINLKTSNLFKLDIFNSSLTTSTLSITISALLS